MFIFFLRFPICSFRSVCLYLRILCVPACLRSVGRSVRRFVGLSVFRSLCLYLCFCRCLSFCLLLSFRSSSPLLVYFFSVSFCRFTTSRRCCPFNSSLTIGSSTRLLLTVAPSFPSPRFDCRSSQMTPTRLLLFGNRYDHQRCPVTAATCDCTIPIEVLR